MDIKRAKTIDEQIDILVSRGLSVGNRKYATEVLSNLNYYVLSGYLHDFKNSDGNYTLNLANGLTFEHIYQLYKFDCSLRSILLYAIEHVEQRLKTKMAYIIALAYQDDPCIYESSDLFKNRLDHVPFMRIFRNTVEANKNVPFVKHHIQNYDGHFPIWVAVELFTIGNLRHLYLNLPNNLRRKISSLFDISPDILDSQLENLRITRNILAHNMRLYGITTQLTPKMPKRHYVDKLARNRIFDQIRLIGILYPDETKWGKITAELGDLFRLYEKEIELNKIGFPSNWRKYLMK